jgi:two-component system response regulator DesR
VDPALATESLVGGSNPLSEREREILRAALAGDPVAEIARTVHLSQGTVRNYLSGAIAKTGAANRMAAARTAEANGWL